MGFPVADIMENSAGNSLEFVMFYAAFLFLPRLRREKSVGQAGRGDAARGSATGHTASVVPWAFLSAILFFD